MPEMLIVASAATLIITAVAHSWLGERRLIGVLLREDHAILGNQLARFVLRFAWHLTSVAWLSLAAILLGLALNPQSIRLWVTASVGVAFVAAGIFDAVGSRGRHVGWPLLTLAGIFALLSIYL